MKVNVHLTNIITYLTSTNWIQLNFGSVFLWVCWCLQGQYCTQAGGKVTISKSFVTQFWLQKPILRTVVGTALRQLVGNKAKGWISKRVFQENKARQVFRKTNIFYPLIRTHTINFAHSILLGDQSWITLKFSYFSVWSLFWWLRWHEL